MPGSADDLVYQGTRGGVLRNGNVNRRTCGPAAIAIGEPRLTPHGQRHLWRSQPGQRQGCSTDAGARHGEHDIDLYGYLFPDHLDDVANRLDAMGRAAADMSADYVQTQRCCGPSATEERKAPTGP